MNARFLVRFAPVAVIAWQLLAGPALAQQPSAAAIAAARELVELKGAGQMFDPIIVNIVEQTKGALLQTNPQLNKDLTEVSIALRGEFLPRSKELLAEAAKFYAQRFTDAELKELVTFYKSPIGRKMVTQEPQALDETFKYVEQWTTRVGEDVMNRYRAEMKKKGHNL
jgi:uncharacterized protein